MTARLVEESGLFHAAAHFSETHWFSDVAQLILLGLATVALPYTSVIAGIGGIALVVFGILTIKGSRKATLRTSEVQTIANPYMPGLITSAANPCFWIWWLSIGSAMVIAGLEGGLALAVAVMVGHWTADIAWYTFVSTGVSKGKTALF